MPVNRSLQQTDWHIVQLFLYGFGDRSANSVGQRQFERVGHQIDNDLQNEVPTAQPVHVYPQVFDLFDPERVDSWLLTLPQALLDF